MFPFTKANFVFLCCWFLHIDAPCGRKIKADILTSFIENESDLSGVQQHRVDQCRWRKQTLVRKVWQSGTTLSTPEIGNNSFVSGGKYINSKHFSTGEQCKVLVKKKNGREETNIERGFKQRICILYSPFLSKIILPITLT